MQSSLCRLRRLSCAGIRARLEVCHNATHSGRGLNSGTSPERIAPESLTRPYSGFVHRNISRLRSDSGTRSSLARSGKRRHGGEILKPHAPDDRPKSQVQNQAKSPPAGPIFERQTPERFQAKACPDLIGGAAADGHCVLATRGGEAWVMNWVASSIAVPSGVGITIRNGTRMRVPATGAKAISMLRWAARYLITGRSGM